MHDTFTTVGFTSQLKLFLCCLGMLSAFPYASAAQCPAAQGDEVAYGAGSWIGYVYNQRSNFSAVNYQGFITETEQFDESFCGNTCDFTTNGCDVTTTNFSVRFKMRQTFACGVYDVTIGGDDGVRLSIDGGANFIIDDYGFHAYQTTTVRLALDGTYDLVLEYFEGGGDNRVSFDYVNTGLTSFEGIISSDQSHCSSGGFNPDVINSLNDAVICGNPITYQWESSTDNVTFADISGATAVTYDPPANLPQTTYYRRKATDGVTILTSNTIVITVIAPQGDEVSYGAGSWIGYVYDGADNYNTNDYHGFITESELFDESFCGGNCTFSTNGCDVQTETFSVRFRMRQTFPCGVYSITIGADDGVRLSIDGGATYLISDYSNHGYRTRTQTVNLDGTYDLVLDYYEAGGGNRVSFDCTLLSTAEGGVIAGDQTYCNQASVDPSAFSSTTDALICGSVIAYQWQSSVDNVSFVDIPGATNVTYDPPAGVTQTTYYRREASGGGTTVLSNAVQVTLSVPQGDEVSYGAGSWIGYVYDGTNNFVNNYQGFITEPETFDESFCGNNCTFATNGCAVQAETYSVRFRMRRNFPSGDYELTIGGDDGVRLSLDGGATYVLSDFGFHGYRTTTGTFTLTGSYDLVFEYYEGGGGNRVSFDFRLINPLPIELVAFKATLINKERNVQLDWQTATETNNDFFTIERSMDAISWDVVTTVDGAGNSVQPKSYYTVDYKPYVGTSYYRLKQTDFDGTTTYSNVVAINRSALGNEQITVYPNPTDGIVLVEGATEELQTLQVYNALGKVLTNRVGIDKSNPTQTKLDLSRLPAGCYFIVTGNNQMKVQKH